jgi:two-component system NtrC family sensor kinase
MKHPLRIPIRTKILFSLLFLVTGVVSVITFTMASLFHEDKRAYVRDLVSMVAMNTSEESRITLAGYRNRVQAYARILLQKRLPPKDKAALLQSLFHDFPELIGISVHEGNAELDAAYNSSALESAAVHAGAIQAELANQIASAAELEPDEVRVRNASVSPRLPSFAMVLKMPQESNRQVVISAMISLDALLHIASRSKGFEVFLADADGVLLAHPDERRVADREPSDYIERHEAHAGLSLGITRDYKRDGIDMIGGIYGVNFAGVTASAHLPTSTAFLASRALLNRLRFVAPLLLVIAAIAGFIWARRITRPVEQLSMAAKEIGQGRFDVKIRIDSRDEIGTLATSFNQMASELETRERALGDAQAQLVQSEKLAAFGQLGAGIAHEVKNPLAGILGCAQISLRHATEDSRVHKNLQLIEKETRRCKTIIENLLKFARQEKAVMEPVEVNAVVEDAVAIVNHQLEMHKVELEHHLTEGLPQIDGNANQLQQVLMNLILNAQQAMDGEPGKIRVFTHGGASGEVELVVSDTGPGMTQDVREKLFEPFFTTKPGGKGTGLGLSVSYGIIKDHGGEISVDSEPGKGATFSIKLPAPRT